MPVDKALDLGLGEGTRRQPAGNFLQQSRLSQDRRPVVNGLGHTIHPGMLLNVLLQGSREERMEFDPLDQGGRVFPLAGGQFRKVSAPLFRDPIGEAFYPHLPQTQRRQNMIDKIAQGTRKNHHHGFGTVHPRVGERQISDSVEGDRCLARARCAANHEKTWAAMGNQFELLGIDQACDLGQPFVCPHTSIFVVRPQASSGALAKVEGPKRDALPSAHACAGRRCALPSIGTAGIRREVSLRRLDTLQFTLLDTDRTPHRDDTDAFSAGDFFVVLVALTVAVENF